MREVNWLMDPCARTLSEFTATSLEGYNSLTGKEVEVLLGC